MSAARWAGVAGLVGAVATFLLLAPLAGRQSGLVAMEYGDSSLLQPQALVTAAIIGSFVALTLWLHIVRPPIRGLARLAVSIPLMLVTLLAAVSIGGAVLMAPALILVYWWLAYSSDLLGGIGLALLVSAITFEAIAFMATDETVAIPLGALELIALAGMWRTVLRIPG